MAPEPPFSHPPEITGSTEPRPGATSTSRARARRAGGLAEQGEHQLGDGLLAGGQHHGDGGDRLGVAVGHRYGDRRLAEDGLLVLDGVALLHDVDERLLEGVGLDDGLAGQAAQRPFLQQGNWR